MLTVTFGCWLWKVCTASFHQSLTPGSSACQVGKSSVNFSLDEVDPPEPQAASRPDIAGTVATPSVPSPAERRKLRRSMTGHSVIEGTVGEAAPRAWRSCHALAA